MNQFYGTDEEIESLVQAFTAKTLDKALWTHAAPGGGHLAFEDI